VIGDYGEDPVFLTPMTRNELARQAGVSVEFLEVAEELGMVRRGRQRAGLVSWVVKLRNLRSNGLSWDEIYAWTQWRSQLSLPPEEELSSTAR
jgi:hypothetical protein